MPARPILRAALTGDFSLIMENLENFETDFANARGRILKGTEFEEGRGPEQLQQESIGQQTGEVEDPAEAIIARFRKRNP